MIDTRKPLGRRSPLAAWLAILGIAITVVAAGCAKKSDTGAAGGAGAGDVGASKDTIRYSYDPNHCVGCAPPSLQVDHNKPVTIVGLGLAGDDTIWVVAPPGCFQDTVTTIVLTATDSSSDRVAHKPSKYVLHYHGNHVGASCKTMLGDGPSVIVN